MTEGLNPNSGAEFGAQLVSPTESPIYIVLLIVGLVWSFYLLFGNSPIARDKHIG